MEQLTLKLMERMSLLLLLMFLFTRVPLFRYFFEHKSNVKAAAAGGLLFGLLGIAGTYAGVIASGDRADSFFWLPGLQPNEAVIGSSLIGVVMAGLMGGLRVGFLAGLITGLHAYSIGSFTGQADAISLPLIGLLAGCVTRFFEYERVIAPVKAAFIGVFAPFVQIGILLILHRSSPEAIAYADYAGAPLIIANSIGIGLFVIMINTALREEERAAAVETQKALKIAEMALPYMKLGLTADTAAATATLLLKELDADAVSIADTERILAYSGIGMKDNRPGGRIASQLALRSLKTGSIQISSDPAQFRPNSPLLRAAIIVPVRQSGKTAGLIQLYYRSPRQLRRVEEVMLQGLSKLISNQLELSLTEKLNHLRQEAELRALQAQINPHFLFNTLNSILTLIRIDPDTARRVTLQLGSYMRMNLTMTQMQKVPLEQEIRHLETYLDIVRIRFRDQLTIRCEMDPAAASALIPPSSIQPLVENSIQYGLKDRAAGGLIRIIVRAGPYHAYISVQDNGRGFPKKLLGKLGTDAVSGNGSTGLGIHNVCQRLTGLYGPEAMPIFENRPEGGAHIRFKIPLR